METLFDPTTVSTIVAGIIALILAVGNVIQEYQKKDKDKTIAAGEVAVNAGIDLTKNVIKFFSSDVPMDAEQEALITTEIVPAKTWKMDDATYNEMIKQLKEGGAVFNERGIRYNVDILESKMIPEYGLIFEDHDRNAQTNCKCVFVSYGRFSLMPAASVYAACNHAVGAPVIAIAD